ncbi:MAG: NAD(P)-binding domain-containing protein [Anaerolineales bacterium]|nr:NAD(P)-binding domain-containing protein [Anaerolineales bacterium]
MKTLIIGTGKIGCGFAGQLMRASGHEVVFASRNPAMVDYFNRIGSYRVRLAAGQNAEEHLIDQTRAVSTSNKKEMADELTSADLIITAVGAGQLAKIAPMLADGLRGRTTPVNVLAFENMTNAGSYLRQLIADNLPRDHSLAEHGFSSVLVSRAVSQQLGDPTSDDLITFIGDPIDTWVVDNAALCQSLPATQGMIVTENFEAWIQRKLYTYSAGHAITAYLGYLKGYHYIHTAIRDHEIRNAVLSAMKEGQRGLDARYGHEIAGSTRDLLDIISRFDNASLNDPITRVGRDPKRKLGCDDRLVGAARLAEKAGVNPEMLAFGVAAALFFDNPDDPSAADLQHAIRIIGAGSALRQVSGLDPSRGVGRLIADFWKQLSAGWRSGNQLLSLNSMVWAWS